MLTAIVATPTFRDLYYHRIHRGLSWIFPLSSVLPRWAELAVNLAFYSYLAWLCFWVFRAARGRERILVVAWFFVIFSTPIQHFVSTFLAVVILQMKALAMAAALVAALDIFARSPTDKVQA